MSSLARAAVRGSAYVVSGGLLARVVGVVGTLVLTRHLAPEAYGEVQAASVVVATAGQISTLGWGQYVISHPEPGGSAAFHATVFHVVAGVAALGMVLALSSPLGHWMGAPGVGAHLPGLALACLLDRVAFTPERVLVRDMRFGAIATGRAAGELTYTALSVAMAVAGWGASAVVAGNVARSAVRTAALVGATGLASWLAPHRLTWATTRTMLAYGLPVSIGASAGYAARRWDNLLMSAMFGPTVLGTYNLAYNLADVPAVQVGEQIADVLLPSFTRLDPQRRPAALARSIAILSLLMSPLAIGLGAVAPTLVGVLLDARWVAVGPMLMVLSALSFTRPLSGVVVSYLQAEGRVLLLMVLDLSRLVLLVGAVITLGRGDPMHACAAVGVAFTAHTLASVAAAGRSGALRVGEALVSALMPAVACVPMVLAVVATRAATQRAGASGAAGLALEIVVGALAYPPAAWWLAPDASRDLIALARSAASRTHAALHDGHAPRQGGRAGSHRLRLTRRPRAHDARASRGRR